MGKVSLHLEVDADLVRDLEARGIDPLRFAEAGFSEAYDRAKRWDLNESAKRKAADPEGSMRRAREWAERNKDAIVGYNHSVAEHGLMSDLEEFRPDWLR